MLFSDSSLKTMANNSSNDDSFHELDLVFNAITCAMGVVTAVNSTLIIVAMAIYMRKEMLPIILQLAIADLTQGLAYAIMGGYRFYITISGRENNLMTRFHSTLLPQNQLFIFGEVLYANVFFWISVD